MKYFKIILSGFFHFTLSLSISSVLILVRYHFRQLAKIPFFLIYENFYRRFEFFDNNRCWFRYQQSKFRVHYSNEEGWRLKTININKSKHISTFSAAMTYTKHFRLQYLSAKQNTRHYQCPYICKHWSVQGEL